MTKPSCFSRRCIHAGAGGVGGIVKSELDTILIVSAGDIKL